MANPKEAYVMGIYYENNNYPYLYETHLHTNQASACANHSGSEMALALHQAGYSGMYVTDHFYYGNSSISKQLSWTDWVEAFTKGYEDAKKTGDKLGLQVFLGWESCYQGTEFLIYGLNKEWLLKHPEIKDATIQEQFTLVDQAGGIVIHAHPFRKEWYIPDIRLYPEYVHGVEVINATHSNRNSVSHNIPEFDTQAKTYAMEHNLAMTGGSDIHSTLLFGGGVAFREKLLTEKDYCSAIKQKKEYQIFNGNEDYYKTV